MTTTADPATSTAPADAPAPAKKTHGRGGMGLTILAWLAALIFFAPVLWMVLTSFHQEADAASTPPNLFAPLTLSQYNLLFSRNLSPFLINSATTSIVSTIIVIVLAAPAAYALSIKPVAKWRDVLFFFLSTKMLPSIAALLPIYLIAKNLGMLDNVYTLVILYTSMNLPIAIWMMRSFLLEVPREVLEAAQVDGAGFLTMMWRVVVPMIAPGLAATALICFIFSWNEFLFAVNLTSTRAGTAPVFLVGFITNEGLFLARLCAAATLVSLPVLIAGWVAQDKLVRGLSLGAIK